MIRAIETEKLNQIFLYEPLTIGDTVKVSSDLYEDPLTYIATIISEPELRENTFMGKDYYCEVEYFWGKNICKLTENIESVKI